MLAAAGLGRIADSFLPSEKCDILCAISSSLVLAFLLSFSVNVTKY